MLVDQGLLKHRSRYQRQHSVFAAFEHFWVFPLLLLLDHILLVLRTICICRSECDCAWIFRILALIVMNLQRALPVCTATHIMRVINHHDTR